MKHAVVQTVVLAVLVSGSVAFGDDGAARCAASTLQGRYVFSASGFAINAASGAAQPRAIVEVIDFAGDETLSVPAATRSVNGAVARSLPSVGSYTVGPDCAGTITFAGPSFDIFVDPRGERLFLIQTDPGNVFSGSAVRTSRELGDRDIR